MAMLRKLLTDRFGLTFHREKKEFSIYELTVAKTGPKLVPSTAPPDQSPTLTSTLYPAASGGIDKAVMPARNATMAQFASILQRGALDRPVVDSTGISGRFDFDLEWTPDETQFGGNLPPGLRSTPTSASSPTARASRPSPPQDSNAQTNPYPAVDFRRS